MRAIKNFENCKKGDLFILNVRGAWIHDYLFEIFSNNKKEMEIGCEVYVIDSKKGFPLIKSRIRSFWKDKYNYNQFEEGIEKGERRLNKCNKAEAEKWRLKITETKL